MGDGSPGRIAGEEGEKEGCAGESEPCELVTESAEEEKVTEIGLVELFLFRRRAGGEEREEEGLEEGWGAKARLHGTESWSEEPLPL